MSFRDLNIKTEYRSPSDKVIQDFYEPVLSEAILYKRAVGFFSSTALADLTKGIIQFIENGGRIQLIASPKLSQEDVDAINNGFERRNDIIVRNLTNSLLDVTGEFDKYRLNLLSHLIAIGKLDIKIAILEEGSSIGMFHEKLGLLFDEVDNVIAFTGSMNETSTAFSLNYESIDVYTSWTYDEVRVKNKIDAFDMLWYDQEPCIRVLDFPEVDKAIIEKYQFTPSLEEAISRLKEYDRNIDCNDEHLGVGPRIPKYVELRDYQIQAIDNWEENNYKGIFDMATGTGKTYTGLAAITRLFEAKKKKLAVIIVCPYQHLVEQWKEDIIAFGMKPIVAYSTSLQRKWKSRLKTSVMGFMAGVIDHFSMVTTNATFSSEYVQEQIRKLHGNVVIVVDEAHNLGATKLSLSLPDNIEYRLGLSATFDRFWDPEGSAILHAYFGDKCLEYTLKDAIDDGMLTPYYYYPMVVHLNDREFSEYLYLTKLISNHLSKDGNGKIHITEQARRYLIKRARLVAGTQEKLKALKSLMVSYKDDNQMLVYCGATTLHDIDYDEDKPPVEEAKQIDLIADMLGNDFDMKITRFTSTESALERENIKKAFAEGKDLQALVAIRCLDEGVNIPSIKTAFILASSTNPKEYIQRRGRVLRNYPGKKYAVIYDFVTLPINENDIDMYPDEIVESVKGLAIKEITRIQEFASIALNPFASDDLIFNIKTTFDIKDDIEEEFIDGSRSF